MINSFLWEGDAFGSESSFTGRGEGHSTDKVRGRGDQSIAKGRSGKNYPYISLNSPLHSACLDRTNAQSKHSMENILEGGGQ